MNPQPYADNFTLVLRAGGYPVIHEHTPQHPFCLDPTCPCHELDAEAIAQVQQWYNDGLLTAQDATNIIMGRRPW